MSFRVSFHLALLGPTGAYWLDDPSDVSCKETTRQYPVDGPLLSCKQWLSRCLSALCATGLASLQR